MRTLAEKEVLKQQELENKKRTEQKLRNLFEPYTGGVEGLQEMEPTEELLNAGWNLHNLFPITRGDTVYLHPDQEGVPADYVRVIHYEASHVSVLNKSHFK